MNSQQNLKNNLLQSEIDWVMSNPEGYDGLWHQKAVCGNIRKRYTANEVTKRIKYLEQSLLDIKNGKNNPCYIVDVALGIQND